MNIHELYIYPILEIDTAAQLTGPPGPIINNFDQMLKLVAKDNTKQAKDLLVPRFNLIVKYLQQLSDTCKTTPQSCAMNPQNRDKYYQQLKDYRQRMGVIKKTPDTMQTDDRVDHETSDIARSSGNPLSFKNYLVRKAAK